MNSQDVLPPEQIAIARRLEAGGREQLLSDHAERVSRLARTFAAGIGLERLAGVAGNGHDFGKQTPAFQAYIRDEKGPAHSPGFSHIAS